VNLIEKECKLIRKRGGRGMNRRLMIKILELLEKSYPKPCTAKELMEKTELKDIDGEFSKIMRYLKSSNKIIHLLWESKTGLSRRDTFAELDEITIIREGIDFLTELKKVDIDDKRNKNIERATVVLALVGFIQAIVYFLQFNKEVKNIFDIIASCVLGIFVIIVFVLSWRAFSEVILRKR
jgi:hypothetical protein